MGSARGGLMLTEHLLGVPLPRHLNSLIAQIPGVGAAFATMLPIVGIVLAIELLGKLIEKHIEAQRQIDEGWRKAADSFEDSSHHMAESLLTVQKKTDELTKDHAAALRKELQLIDMQSMDSLVAEFEKVDKTTEETLKKMESSWQKFLELIGVSGMGAQVQMLKDYDEELEKVKNIGAGPSAAASLLKTDIDEVTGKLEKMKSARENNAVVIDDYGHTAIAEASAEEKSLEKVNEQLKQKLSLAQQAVTVDVAKGKNTGIEEAHREAEEKKRIAEKEAAAAEKLFKEIEARNAQSVDNRIEQDKKEGEEAEKLFKEIEGRNEQSANNRIEQDKKEAEEAEKLFLEIEKRNEASVDARIKQEEKLLKARQKYEEQGARAATNAIDQMLFDHKKFSQVVEQLGKRMLENLISNTMQGLLVEKSANAVSQLEHAKAWASGAGSAVAGIPIIGPILAPIAAASGFAAAMAFEKGGLVPGSGSGDTVPSLLSPGETVVTRALTEKVAQSQGGGQMGGQGHVIQHSPYNVSTMDSRGFSSMLQKHDAEFQAHAVATMRKLNMRAGRG